MMKPRLNSRGDLPNAIIIGAMKCATTSLHFYLNLHPEIAMSRVKELNFFVRERNWHKGTSWYQSNFRRGTKIRGESSVSYTNWPARRGIPGRMYAVVPHVKLIYSVRDPIDRIISHYAYSQADGLETRSFSQILENLGDNNPYIARSKYFMQIERYLDVFPVSNLLIVTVEELYHRRRATLQKIFRFLDVDATFCSEKFEDIIHKSAEKRRKTPLGLILKGVYEKSIARAFPLRLRMRMGQFLSIPFSREVVKPAVNDTVREALASVLRKDLDRLRTFAGRKFRDWCV